MIWRRLKQYAGEQEAKQPPEGERDEVHVSFRERLVMVLTYAVIVLPCLLVLIGLSLLACWLFGLL